MLLPVLSVCLLLLLIPSPVRSLDCYVCSSSATNEECNQNTQECVTPLDTCMTTVDILGTTKAIVKQCASRATCDGAAASATVDANGNGNKVNCCSAFNLCNFSRAQPLGASTNAHTLLLLLLSAAALLLTR